MELTHVCVWDPKVGYRRVSINEACALHPYGVNAKSGHFVCELCAANVLLTAPGVYAQHFRHDPSSPNKECDERQSSFDKNYGRSFVGLSSHIMPFRIQVTTSRFTLQLGFFFPPDARVRCDKIKIASDNHQVFEYSFERINRIGTTYLDVGGFPGRIYGIEYVNANQQLRIADMFSLQQQSFDTYLQALLENGEWTPISFPDDAEYLRLDPPFIKEYWKRAPDKDGRVSLVRYGEPNKIYQFYRDTTFIYVHSPVSLALRPAILQISQVQHFQFGGSRHS